MADDKDNGEQVPNPADKLPDYDDEVMRLKTELDDFVTAKIRAGKVNPTVLMLAMAMVMGQLAGSAARVLTFMKAQKGADGKASGG